MHETLIKKSFTILQHWTNSLGTGIKAESSSWTSSLLRLKFYMRKVPLIQLFLMKMEEIPDLLAKIFQGYFAFNWYPKKTGNFLTKKITNLLLQISIYIFQRFLDLYWALFLEANIIDKNWVSCYCSIPNHTYSIDLYIDSQLINHWFA